MKKRRIAVKSLLGILAAACVLLSGCTLLSEEKIKLRDLDFTVLSEEKIPEELKTILEEKKSAPFQITYTDKQNLYICVGYGEQETGGYSIAVEELYLTGLHIEQYRHATYRPDPYYLEALKRDAGDIRTNNAYGSLLMRRGCFLEAEKHFRTNHPPGQGPDF